MKDTMMTFIRQEKEACRMVLDNRMRHLESYLEQIKELQEDRWYVLSTGSSYNAMTAAKFYVEKIAKVQVDFKVVNTYIHYERPIEDGIVFAVSQGGKSYSTIEALKKTKKVPRFTLTLNTASPIVDVSDTVIDIGCGPESVGYVTKGYSATMLTFMLIGLETARVWRHISADAYQAEIDSFYYLVDKMGDVLERTERWYERYKRKLIEYDSFVAIGYGPETGVVQEFDTKFTETIRGNVNAYELEEYMHGPYLAVRSDQAIFFFDSGGGLKSRMERLIGYTKIYNDHCYKITREKEDTDAGALCLDAQEDDYRLPLLMAIPVQYLAYQIAEAQKSDYESGVFDDFGPYMGSKIKK